MSTQQPIKSKFMGADLGQLSGTDEFQSLGTLEKQVLSHFFEEGQTTGTYDLINSLVQFGRVSVFEAPTIARQWLAHPNIQTLLGLHFGEEGIANFLRHLADDVSRPKADPEKVLALQFFFAGVIAAPQLKFNF